MKTFMVGFWAAIFAALRYISVFEFLRCAFPKIKEPGTVDLWVLGNLVTTMLLLLLQDVSGWAWWEFVLVGYSGIRIVEVVVYQINVLLFDAYRKRKAGQKYVVRSLRRLVLLLLLNYVEIVFWFGIIYRHLSSQFYLSGEASMNSYFQSLSLSFHTMSAFGRSVSSPATPTTDVLVQIQAAIGFFMALVILARFIGIIPQPETADEMEKRE